MRKKGHLSTSDRRTKDTREFKIGHYGRLGRLDRCYVTQNTRDLYRCPSGTLRFRRVSRRKDNGETDNSSCICIDTFLLKRSSQWVKYALACVYIDLPIGEMKKKAKISEFIHNLARGRMATACSTQCRPQWQRKIAEKKGKAQFKR